MQTRRFSPLCGPSSSSCGGLQPLAKAFFLLRAKKEFFRLFVLILSYFWCSVVTSIIFSSNLSNFEKNKTLKNLERKKSKLSKNCVFFNSNFLKYAIWPELSRPAQSSEKEHKQSPIIWNKIAIFQKIWNFKNICLSLKKDFLNLNFSTKWLLEIFMFHIIVEIFD